MTKIKVVVQKGNGNLNKIVGDITSITNDNPNQICKQLLINKHFRNIGRKAFEQQEESQKEYKKVFHDNRNGWLS